MKAISSTKNSIKLFTLLLLSMLSSAYVFAQDAPEKVDVNINADGGTAWFGQPWMWAIGVGIFILVLVIVTRSNKSADA